MLAKLALRNVRRQFLSYFIYFITVVLAVALMFAVNNVLFSEEFKAMGRNIQETVSTVLGFMVALVTAIVAFIIAYATMFMLRKRKREFGTYMLMGIRRSDVVKLFVIENLIIGGVSFVAGIVLGFGVFAILNVLVCRLMGSHFGPLKLTPGSFGMTLLLWAAVFAVAIIYGALHVRNAPISEMVKTKPSRFKILDNNIYRTAATIVLTVLFAGAVTYTVLVIWALLTTKESYFWGTYVEVASLLFPMLGVLACGILAGLIPMKPIVQKILRGFMIVVICATVGLLIWLMAEYQNIFRRETMLLDYNVLMTLIPAAIMLLLVSVFLFYYYSRGFFTARTQSKRKFKNANAFHFRQISTAVKQNSAIMATIALLLSVAVFMCNFAFTMRFTGVAEIEKNSQFDIVGWWEIEKEPVSGDTETPEALMQNVYSQTDISFSHLFGFYHSSVIADEQWFLKGDPKCGILKESDFNALMKERGKARISLADGGFYLLHQYAFETEEPAKLEIFGKELGLDGVRQENIGVGGGGMRICDFYVVLKDNILSSAEWESHLMRTMLAINTKDYVRTVDDEGHPWANIVSKFAALDEINSSSAVYQVAALFFGITMMFMSMALLSLKVMAEADLDKRRFSILNMLGADISKQRKILFRQIFSFFLPLILPFALSFPSTVVCAFISYNILGSVPKEIYAIGAAVPLVFLALYGLYFAASYYLSSKNSITPHKPPDQLI